MAETRLYRGDDAASDAVLAASMALEIRDKPLTVDCLELFAAANAARGNAGVAATMLAATEAVRESEGLTPDDDEAAIRSMARESLRTAGADPTVWATGRTFRLDELVDVARGELAQATKAET
jgi:hypothetical protein